MKPGVPGYDKGAWTGMFAPAKVPDAIIARMYQAVAEILKNPDAVKSLAADGLVAVASSPEDFGKFVHAEIVEWTKLVREIRADPRPATASSTIAAAPPERSAQEKSRARSPTDTRC